MSETTAPPPEVSPEGGDLQPEDVVTEEILTGILENLNRPDLKLVDYESKLGTVAGDNYMSLIYAVKLNMKNSSTGEKETVPVMLKVLPRNEFRIKMINEANIFLRDIRFYEKIAPAMEKFQRDRGLPEDEIFTPWPKCYACKTDGKEDFLAMEDLKVHGFRMANRQLGLDLEHCKLVIKTLARFHAISYAMFQGDFDAILEKYPWLEELMFKEERNPQAFKDLFKNTFSNQASIVREAGHEEAAARMDQIYTEDYFTNMFKLVGGKVKWAVIGHGDSWTNNILFRYDEETNKPVEIKLVDFQVCRVANRAIDIHYFFYSSPQVQVLNDNEEELEQIYFDEFTASAKKLGVDVDAHELTKENFMEEIANFRYYGCVAGLMLAMVTSAESSDVPEMETMTEEDISDKDKSKNFFVGMMKGKAIEKIKNIATVHLPKCPQAPEA